MHLQACNQQGVLIPIFERFGSVEHLHAEMQQEEELKKASKPKAGKTRQTKLDQNGNKPEVSVYAKAYNKVKSQFSRIRWVFTPVGGSIDTG